MTTSAAPNNPQRYSLSWYVRSRWNILDLIQLVRRGSVSAYLFVDIDMTWVEEMRKRLAAQGVKTTVTAFLLKAIGIAQHAHPNSRAVLLPWGQTMTMNRIVAGFTCEKFVDGEPAVYLGLIHDPDQKSLSQISSELRDYSQKTIPEVPQLALEEWFNHLPWIVRRIFLLFGLAVPWFRLKFIGASFGLSSLGKQGMTAIIPPSVNTSIFGVGKVEDRPVVRDGQIVIRKMTTLTLNFDHRLIDGAPAAYFLTDVQKLLEGGLSEYIDETGEIKTQPSEPPFVNIQETAAVVS
jgi:hypothetical protein